MASSQPPSDQRTRQLSTSGDSLYILLGIPKNATVDEIKRSYRKKALTCHPDKNRGNEDATEVFKMINHANAVLTDPTKKKIYDTYGSMGLNLASQIGEERFGTYLLLQKPWAKALCIFAFLFTGCCFCCCCLMCCNCCCGKCGPKQEDEEYDNFNQMQNEDVEAPPVMAEPISASASYDRDQLIEADPKTPIALGPPPGQHISYGSIVD